MIILDIIIVNWNSGEMLNNCLSSIEKSNLNNILVNIIIVDNDSNDDSLNKISSKVEYTLIKNGKNFGFAKACNIGLSESNGKYILFLNPDTEVRENTLQKAIKMMEDNENISVLGVKHFDDCGNVVPSCSRFPKLSNFLYDIFGLSMLLPKHFYHATLMRDMDYTKSTFVDQVSGAFFFCRRSVLKKVGNFDERFFIYYEEMDLSYRIKRSGGASYYDADNEIYHKGGGVTDQVRAKRLFYCLRSRIKYSFKYYDIINAILLLVLTLIVEPFSRLIYLILNGRFSEINELIIAYYYLFLYFIMRNAWNIEKNG